MRCDVTGSDGGGLGCRNLASGSRVGGEERGGGSAAVGDLLGRNWQVATGSGRRGGRDVLSIFKFFSVRYLWGLVALKTGRKYCLRAVVVVASSN